MIEKIVVVVVHQDDMVVDYHLDAAESVEMVEIVVDNYLHQSLDYSRNDGIEIDCFQEDSNILHYFHYYNYENNLHYHLFDEDYYNSTNFDGRNIGYYVVGDYNVVAVENDLYDNVMDRFHHWLADENLPGYWYDYSKLEKKNRNRYLNCIDFQ